MEVCIAASRTTLRARAKKPGPCVDRQRRVVAGPRAPGRPDTKQRVCYGRGAMQNNDEWGFRLSLVLFTVAIPIIGGIGFYFASQMPY